MNNPSNYMWPSYREAMRQYEQDPLEQLYSGRRYGETPVSEDEYNYLMMAYNTPSMDLSEMSPAQRFKIKQSQEYQDFLELQRKLKQEETQRKQTERREISDYSRMIRNLPFQSVHLLPRNVRERLGITPEEYDLSRRYYQQRREFDVQREREREERQNYNARIAQMQAMQRNEQQQRNMQSAAARGFYQTPFAYQNL